jgi:hypothetical protein
MLLLLKVRGGTLMGQWSPVIQIEPLTTEFELKALEPDTSYLVMVHLLNEAGVGEQKIEKRTSKSRIGKLMLNGFIYWY